MKTDRSSTATTSAIDQVRTRRGGRSERIRASVMAATEKLILDEGFASLSHRTVASAAGVDYTTVYRRWPSKGHLIADLFQSEAKALVKIPDTGSLQADLELFGRRIVRFLKNERIARLMQSAIVASFGNDLDVAAAIRDGWQVRFRQASTMIDNAKARGELGAAVDSHVIIETLVAPVWFRLLVSKAPVDKNFIRTIAGNSFALAKSQ